MKNKTYRFAAVAAVLLALCLVFMAPVSADGGNTLYVVPDGVEQSEYPDQYNSLYAAVTAATAGDTIILKAGDHYKTDDGDVTIGSSESSEIVKGITIKGEGRDTTYFHINQKDASQSRGFLIYADNVIFDNFTIVNDYTIYQTNNNVINPYGDNFTLINCKVNITTDMPLGYIINGNGAGNKKITIQNSTFINSGSDVMWTVYSGYYAEEHTALLTFTGNTITGKFMCGLDQVTGNYVITENTFNIENQGDLANGVGIIVTEKSLTTDNQQEVKLNTFASSAGSLVRILPLGLAGNANNPVNIIVSDAKIPVITENSLTQENTHVLDISLARTHGNHAYLSAVPSISVDDNNGGSAVKAITSIYDQPYQELGSATASEYLILQGVNLPGSTWEEGVLTLTQSGTYKLAGNVELAAALAIKNDITLDLNGLTLSSSTDTVVVSGTSASLTVKDSSVGETGKITSSVYSPIWVYDGATVTLDSGTLNSTSISYFAIQVGAHRTPSPGTFVMNGGKLEAVHTGLCIVNGTATINGGSISGGSYGISGNGGENNGVTDGTTVIITGGKIEATNSTIDEKGRIATAIYQPQDGTLTISGGEITGPNGIQFVGDGKLTISGGTISGTYASTIQYPILNSNGGIANGAALSIVKVGSKADGIASGYGTEALVASITGGTFSSKANDAIRIYGNDTADGDGVEGVTLLNPVKFIKGGIFTTAPAEKYLVDNYEVVSKDGGYKVQEKKQVTTTTTTTTSKPKEEPPVEEPVTPTEPVAGEVTVETEVTNGGEVSFETPAAEGSEPVADAPVEISAVVLPEGTTGEVAFIPVSEQPAPAGKETQTKKVFEINVPTYEKGKAAVVKFTMTVAELAADGKTAAEVALWHFDEETGEWTKLVTSYTIVDGVVYFEAITYDFSPFAIIYEDAVEQPEQPVEEPETPASPAPLFAVLAALGAAVVLRRK